MANWKKNVLPAVGLLAAVGSFVIGNEVRTRIDTGRSLKAMPQSYMAGIESNFEAPRSVPEGEMFYQLLLLLERDYVDPKIDEEKLAYGAIKGTIGGLWDPLSLYLKPADLEEQEHRLKGEYRGAGLEVREVADPGVLAKVRKGSRPNDPLMLLPTIEVAMVAPGGPAEKVGLKVGDRVTAINGRYVLGYPDIAEIRRMQKAVTEGKITAAQFGQARAEFQRKAKTPLSVGRARDLLMSGEGRQLQLEWSRDGKIMKGGLTTQVVKLKPLEEVAGVFRLAVIQGAAQEVSSKALPQSVTLDLRNSGLGDPSQIQPLLEVLAPAGRFGVIVTEKPGEPTTLLTSKGLKVPRSYRLIVDKSTRGAAEILALALKNKGYAELEGGPMAGEPNWVETHRLADGSGYTLNTGRYSTEAVEARK